MDEDHIDGLELRVALNHLSLFPIYPGFARFGNVNHIRLERDRMFTALLAEETKRLGLLAIKIDTPMTEDHLTERVAEIFGL